MRPALFAPRVLLLALPLASGCSLLVGDLVECATAADCAEGRVCVESLCVPPSRPEGCRGVPAAEVLAEYGAIDEEDAIRLGAAFDLTLAGGSLNPSRKVQLDAALLAIEEINQRTIDGRRLALLVCDTGGDLERLETQVEWLTADPGGGEGAGVDALLVPASGPVLAIAPLAISRGALVISPTATSVELTALSDAPSGGAGLVWRTAPSDVFQGEVLSELLVSGAEGPAGDLGLDPSSVALFYVNDPYGQGLSTLLLGRLGAAGKSVEAYQFERGGSVEQAMAQAEAFAPDVSVAIAFPEDAAKLVTAGEAGGVLAASAGHQWLFTDSAKQPRLLEDSPPGALEGAYGTNPAQGAGLTYGAFASAYRSRFSVEPSDYAFVAHTYDAVYLVALASAWALGSDGPGEVSGASLAEGLTHLSSGAAAELLPSALTGAIADLRAGVGVDVDGASGPLDFDPATGEAPAPVEVWQISSGGFETVDVIAPLRTASSPLPLAPSSGLEPISKPVTRAPGAAR